MRQGYTFDTGMLIALERRGQRAWAIYRGAREMGIPITVPTAVLAEWWRGRTDAREHVMSGVLVEPLAEALAHRAGVAIAHVEAASVVDAIVMASAAARGDVVFTSDVEDLARLQGYFPGVRVLHA